MTLTAEQKAIRSTRLTGSSIAGMLGRSQWESPLEAWEHQTGRREFAGNDDTEAGTVLEAGIGELALRKLPIDAETAATAVSPGTLLHPDWPEVFAVTPDLIIESECAGIQIKNHMPWAARRYKDRPREDVRWHNHMLPDEKLMQCLLELEVVSKVYGDAGRWVWFLAAFFGGSHLRVYWLRRDTRIIASMLQAGRYFHRRHLDPAGPQEPPSPECTCGGCGRGASWWIGRERPAPPRVKMTAAEIEVAPDPFPAREEESGWGDHTRFF